MRKLSIKNKFLIGMFIVIVLVIILILLYSVKLVGTRSNEVYQVNNNTVLFASDSNLIDTKGGGKVEKNWDNVYRYVSDDNTTYDLGTSPIIYDSVKEKITVFGEKYQILKDGSVLKNSEQGEIELTSKSMFYKLDDRVYLIVSQEIYTADKSVYANKYLLVYVDKQGNASLLNDSINLKTINPMNLIFDNYTFDIALERLIVNDVSIDLKSIIGSTNEYVVPEKVEEKFNFDEKELLESYNKLVGDFNQYAKNNNLSLASNNQVSNNQVIVNGNASSSNGNSTVNKTNITKRVSLRGAITNTSYIDVTYVVVDPEDKYQAVYLLVTGNVNDTMTTEKIILDKYQSTYRITGLSPNNEYTISLGYIEVVENENNGKKELVDNIEDIINVRTQKISYNLEIKKISGGYVYFNFKMPSIYAFEQAEIALYINGERSSSVPINYNEMISDKGFDSRLRLEYNGIYELKVENIKYNGHSETHDIGKKFIL
ncbi:MAG: hypothetical protein IKF82_06860 [Bacilli bacterium]|nr:hypothetical protein [Bacilli bacterium]